MLKNRFLILLNLYFFKDVTTFAQNNLRKQMIDSYMAQKKSHSGFYDSPPIYHLVPNFNTISYSLSMEKTNVILTPPQTSKTSPSQSAASSTTALSGYKISPHLAMSLKKVGLGFSAERGVQNVFFRNEYSNQNFMNAQESSLEYSGIGLNFSYLPYQSPGKFLSVALILGWRNYTARHRWSQFITYNNSVDKIEPEYKPTIRYKIDRYQTGININLALLKSIQLIPWADYQYTLTSDATSAFKTAYRMTSVDPVFESDLDLFWIAGRNYNYGLDFAVRLMDFQIRLGGLLGTFANLNPIPDSIEDQTVNISFSWDHKD
jgi:hypothetical protein